MKMTFVVVALLLSASAFSVPISNRILNVEISVDGRHFTAKSFEGGMLEVRAKPSTSKERGLVMVSASGDNLRLVLFDIAGGRAEEISTYHIAVGSPLLLKPDEITVAVRSISPKAGSKVINPRPPLAPAELAKRFGTTGRCCVACYGVDVCGLEVSGPCGACQSEVVRNQ